ncbi:MAG: hypothetical protein Ta2A_24240 [Treponemataceae bacterium]|nr:MAG: hypothetical protein Ta2A_24240 [Treponemataceae bacterium]
MHSNIAHIGDMGEIYFIDKTAGISADLDSLTRTMLMLFSFAFIAVAVLIFFVYPRKKAFFMCSIPIFTVAVSMAVFAVFSVPISFFVVTGMALVLGLGLDYVFYSIEAAAIERASDERDLGDSAAHEKAASSLAITLSFTTTALSFGALALSGFVPVHLFGLAVVTGLSAAFVLTRLYSKC